MFKDKIIAAIKVKYPASNFSKKRMDAIATIIEKKVIDDETKIDAALDAFNEYNPLADIAKQDDILRNLEAQVKAAAPSRDKDKKEDKTDKKPDPDPIDDGTPPWAKALIEQNKTLSAGLAALQNEKVASTMKSKATEKLKDIPISYWGKRVLPETEEALEVFATEVTADYQEFTKDLTEKGISVLPVPKSAGSGAGGGGTDKTVSPEVKAYAEHQKNIRAAEAGKKTV